MNPTIEQLHLANSDYIELRNFMSNKDYMKFLTDKTDFLKEATTKQRLFHLLNNINDIQICSCTNPVKWNIKNNTYRKYCSSKCAHKDESVKLKTEQTCLEKFGKKTNLITAEAKANYAKKMIEKFGVDNPFKSDEVQKSIRNKIFEEHGVRNMSQLESTKEKITETHNKKYNRNRKCQSHFSDESYSIKYDNRPL